MAILEQLQEDIKTAMRNRDKLRLLTLRNLMAEVKNIAIDSGKESTDETVITVVAKGLKTRQDSAQQYQDADRKDLADVELAEIEILKEYQPAQMDEEALRSIISETISSVGATSAKEMGKVMGALMPKVKGKADGGLVNRLVKELLS